MSRLVLFCSKLSRNQPPTPPPPSLLRFHRGSCGCFDRCLNETGSLKGKTTKRTGTLGAAQLVCLLLNGGASWDISSLGIFSKGLELHFQYSRSTADRVTSSLVEVLDKLDPTTVYPVKQGQLHLSAL